MTTWNHRQLGDTLLQPFNRPDDVAQRYGVTTATVRNWVHAGYLEALVLGSGPRAHFRIPREALEAFEKRNSITIR